MKKSKVIGTALATALVAGSMSMTAFAATNPADDASGYSFNAGEQSYRLIAVALGVAANHLADIRLVIYH